MSNDDAAASWLCLENSSTKRIGEGIKQNSALKGRMRAYPQTMYVKALPVWLGDSSVPIKACAHDTGKLQSPPCLEGKKQPTDATSFQNAGRATMLLQRPRLGQPLCGSRGVGRPSHRKGRGLSAQSQVSRRAGEEQEVSEDSLGAPRT